VTRPGLPDYVDLWMPKRANCVLWAFVQQFRWGGHVCWRQSIYGWWPHAVWSLDHRHWYEYTSLAPKHRLRWWEVPGLILFQGRPEYVTRATP